MDYQVKGGILLAIVTGSSFALGYYVGSVRTLRQWMAERQKDLLKLAERDKARDK